jgi:hypothetical protein
MGGLVFLARLLALAEPYLKLGMHVLQADGQVGVITGGKVVPGAQVMYNLEVAQDHTFTVGTGQWIVHNKCDPGERQQLRNNLYRAGQIPDSVDTQAHHIVPCDFKQDLLVAQAINGGFNFNGTNNGIALPTNLAGSTLLGSHFIVVVILPIIDGYNNNWRRQKQIWRPNMEVSIMFLTGLLMTLFRVSPLIRDM